MKVKCDKITNSCDDDCPHFAAHEPVEWYACNKETAYCGEVEANCICIPTEESPLSDAT